MATLTEINIIETLKETEKAVHVSLMRCLKVCGGMADVRLWIAKSQLKMVEGKPYLPSWIVAKMEREYDSIIGLEKIPA